MAVTLPQTAPPAQQGTDQPSYAHPVAAFFLMFFKAAAVFIYIFCGWFGTDFVINFCLITFLLVCDFWTVRVAVRRRGRPAAVPALLGLHLASSTVTQNGHTSMAYWMLTVCTGHAAETMATCAAPRTRLCAGQECVGAAHGGPAVVERSIRNWRQRLEV